MNGMQSYGLEREMQINYQPLDGWAADFIPFYWQGEYHLFYLKDYRDIPNHGEGTPWFHLVTTDFVHFTDYGECLARGTADDQDLYVFTGSVIFAGGKFHIFYTGHNPHFREMGKPEQAILHAVSDDLYTWNKIPEERFFAPEDTYEQNDWRDPFVFWNEAASEYWMLVAARFKAGPSRRRGCTVLCTSVDLVAWQVKEPLYAPHQFYTHECPDLFQMGKWWYLVFSEFSEASVTRYRMARSAAGPWITPEMDTFDGRAFYAAKTASGNNQRYIFGWNPTRTGDKDGGAWNWGGSLVVHELIQRPDGTLAVRIPAAVKDFFLVSHELEFGGLAPGAQPAAARVDLDGTAGFRSQPMGLLPTSALIEVTVAFSAPTLRFGIMLRTSPDSEKGYEVRVEPQRARLVFDSWPRAGDIPYWIESERPVHLLPGKPLQITLYVDGTICEIYLDRQVALSTRMYDHLQGSWGFFVSDGRAEFTHIRLSTP
jgi:beta-fructofuranosidase